MSVDVIHSYLSRFARWIDVGLVLEQSNAEVRQVYEVARRQAGSWSDVLGGYCASSSCCRTTFACLGCARKILDLIRRYQIQRYRQWVMQEMETAAREDRLPQIDVMEAIIQDCDLGLQRMDLFGEYMDAARTPNVHMGTT